MYQVDPDSACSQVPSIWLLIRTTWQVALHRNIADPLEPEKIIEPDYLTTFLIRACFFDPDFLLDSDNRGISWNLGRQFNPDIRCDPDYRAQASVR